jgi:hypothetical protein
MSATSASLRGADASHPAVLDRVSFVVAGVQKGGTWALDAYLREHPELCLPHEKELHFFDADRLFAEEPVDYASYHARFEPRPPQRLLGEVTPAYMYWPAAAERMARYNPAMRIIGVLRNPITRAFSHWNMARQKRREPLPFRDALRAEPDRRRKFPPEEAKRFSYVERGFYAQQLQRLWRCFPVAQTLIFKSEELFERPNEVLGRIAIFLDIAPFPPLAAITADARGYDTEMGDEEKRFLIGVYEAEIRQLERLLGWDCSAWLA